MISFEFEAALYFITYGYLVSKLIFHRVGVAGTSPFDEAIVSVTKGSHIKVVSPYIGLRYFRRLVELSSSWRLISDVEAWLSSLSNQERILSTEFIKNNCERIHHFPAIHAKTVIGRATAYLGSANLTSAGIQSRTEMGMLVDDPEMMADMHSWFDELWQATTMPVMAEVLAYSHGLDSESGQKNTKLVLKSLSFDGKQVHARLMRLSNLSHETVKPEIVNNSPHVKCKSSRDLADEVQLLIEKLANSGFTFKEFLAHVRESGVIFRTRAVYIELSRYCGNLPRSIFSPDTVNRLIYKNGFFRQSTASAVETSLVRHDTFLAMLIAWLSFSDATEAQSQLETHSSSGRVWVRRWLYDLKQSGLLIEYISTKKNLLVNYQLNEKFEWTGRWRLFEQACRAWNIKLKSYRDLACLTNAVTGDGEHDRIETDIAEKPDKLLYLKSFPASNPSLRQSVYVRTQMEKRLPPIIATTVSSGAKAVTFKQEKASIVSIKYRADKVYTALFRRLANSDDKILIRREYSELVHYLSKESQEPVDFILQVIEGRIPSLPAAANVCALNGKCSVSVLLNGVAAYPRTSGFVKMIMGKGQRKLGHPWYDQNKPKVQLPKLPTLSVKSSLNAGSEQSLIGRMRFKEDNAVSSQAPRMDEMSEYMQRVASIFKDSNA